MPMAIKENYRFAKLDPKFTKRLDANEHELRADIEADVEQSEKLQEIIDLLVAAGYFRARIKNIPPFDKVVGGMTWCIEFCNIDVDVDLFYQENSSIGQKIALTEKLVAVLPQIQCPHPIEPHQIQGLDFIHIFPVIQWLVKRSMEFREDVSTFCYSYAMNQFEKNFSLYHGFTGKQQQLLHNLKVVHDAYKPHRVFKKKNAAHFKDIESKVQITLLEYGYKMVSPKNAENANTEQNTNFHMGEEIDEIMNDMDEMQEDTFDYDKLHEEDREKISEHYEKLIKEFEVSASPSHSDSSTNNWIEKRKDIIKSLEKSILQRTKIKDDIEIMRESVTNLKLEQRNVDEAIQSLGMDIINSEKFKEVEGLLLRGDNLEKQKIEFEEHCRKETNRFNDSNEIIERKTLSADTRCKEFDIQIEDEHEKLKVLRLQIAKKNRGISVLQRRIDEVPSRAELAQYQKRFMELYNQISAKHKETKQYYSLYNTLEDTRQYMKKELSLLNSVIDNYPEAMRTKEGKDEFLQQFLTILEGVKHSRLKLENRLSQQKRERDELSDSLHSFIELNRKYATAIKVLKQEFQKNEEFIKSIS